MANLKCTAVWLVLLLVHFNTHLVSSSPIPLNKPMSTQNFTLVCPVFPDPEECPPEPDNECNNDQECAEIHPGLGMKCCTDGCDMRCVTPVQPPTSPVNGTCPVYPPPAECPPEEDLDHECKDDAKCNELYPWSGLKCCTDGCEYMCVAPVNGKAPNCTAPPTSPVNGTCPVFPLPAECPPEEDVDHECTDDAECNELYPGSGLKCCKDGCEYICVSPVNGPTTPLPTSPFNGTCPVFPLPAECPPEDVDHECTDDAECNELYPGSGLKCCKDGCEYICVSPVNGPTTAPPTSPVNGTCPVFPLPAECPPEEDVDHECTDDAECNELYPGSGLKCCKDGCEYICVSPVNGPTTPPPTTPVNGTCPVFPTPAECPPEPDNECNSDQECAEIHPGLGMKCCKDGCDMRCVTPVQPPTSPVNGTCPVFPTPAECPPEPDNECNSDQECAEIHPGLGMKCCKDGCDMRCVTLVQPPTSPVNGTCPVYPPPAECPPEEDLDHECKDDAECNELYPGSGLKCCTDGCEYMCVAPV